MELFSDKALISLFNTSTKKPKNKEYIKLRKKLEGYPYSGMEKDGGCYYKTKVVPYDFIEEFINCPDFLTGGMSVRKIAPKEDGTERRLYRMSVLPAGRYIRYLP